MPALLLEPERAPLAIGAALVASYLLGAVPFGWVLARALRGVDLRTVGSGNIGATNAMRVLGKPLGMLAFLLDFAKGLAPVALLGGSSTPMQVACGGAAVCGHVWPVYLRFRGGKAVATSCGAITGVDPLVSLGGGLVWLLTLVVSGYVSLASVLMGIAFPCLAIWRSREGRHGALFPIATLALTALILVRHRSNMARMLAGNEPKSALFRRASRGNER